MAVIGLGSGAGARHAAPHGHKHRRSGSSGACRADALVGRRGGGSGDPELLLRVRDARRARRQAPARRYRRRHIHRPCPRSARSASAPSTARSRSAGRTPGSRPRPRTRNSPDCLPRFSRPGAGLRRALLVRALQVRRRGPCPDRRTWRASRRTSPRWKPRPGGRHRVKPVDRLMTAREAANVRTGPSPDYDIVGTVMAGDELHVTGEVRGRDWLRVAYPRSGDEAYIYGPLLRAGGATAALDAKRDDPIGARCDSDAPQTSGPSWSIAENQPCEVWNYGNRDYEPLTWSGPCMNGKAAGSGRLVFRNGEGRLRRRHAGRQDARTRGLGLGQRLPLRGRASRRQAARARDAHPGQRRALRGWLARGQAARAGHLHASRRHHLRGGRGATVASARARGRWASIGTTAAACGFE